MNRAHVGAVAATGTVLVLIAASLGSSTFGGCVGETSIRMADGGVADGGVDGGPSSRPAVTIDTYPHVDGSTSTLPLARVIACELLGLDYRWEPGRGSEGEAEIVPVAMNDAERALADRILTQIVHHRTHDAYLALVDGAADLILVANLPSTEERAYAEAHGVAFAWQPIALDALVIVDNAANVVADVSPEEIRSVYQAEITRWSELGGAEQEIHPYIRPVNSGSQQLFDAIVMRGEPMASWPEDRQATYMGGLIDMVRNDPQAMGYSVFYFVAYQYPAVGYRVMAVDGVVPSPDTIGTGQYPFRTEVWVVTRTNLPSGTGAAQMRDWLTMIDGQSVVARSGYVPIHAP